MGTTGATHGHRILQYGFEDFVGPWPTSGTASPCDGYIMTGGSSAGTLYWGDHIAGNQINSSDGTRDAHSGTKYFHHQFYTGAADPYLGGRTSGSFVIDGCIGHASPPNAFNTRPTGTKSEFALASSLTVTGGGELYVFVRYWFRLTDAWNTTSWPVNDTPGLKTCRWYSSGQGISEPFVFMGGAGMNHATMYWISAANDGDYHNFQVAPNNVRQDSGETTSNGVTYGTNGWHSFCQLIRRHNNTNTDPNLSMWTWIDNWNCVGGTAAANGWQTDQYVPSWDPIGFLLCENFNGQVPAALCGIDFDDIEVWDGAPTTEELQGVAALANNGARRYWRMQCQDADGNVSGWSSGADYFDMAITASGGVSLGAMAISGSAIRPITASGGVTLGKIDVIGNARMTSVYASGGVTLGAMTVSGSAERVITESGGVSLGAATVAGSATRIIASSGGITLGGIVLEGETIQNGATPLKIPGAKYYWKMRFKDADGLMSGWSNGADYFITGSTRGDIVLGAMTVAGTAKVTRYASGNVPLGAIVPSGSVTRIVAGSGGVTLGAATVAGSAAHVVTANGGVELGRFRVSGGIARRGLLASGGVPLGAATVAGTTSPIRYASGNIDLGAVTVSGKMANNAAGNITLGAITVSGYSPGMSAVIDVLARIERIITVTARIEKRCAVDAYLEGDHVQ